MARQLVWTSLENQTNFLLEHKMNFLSSPLICTIFGNQGGRVGFEGCPKMPHMENFKQQDIILVALEKDGKNNKVFILIQK